MELQDSGHRTARLRAASHALDPRPPGRQAASGLTLACCAGPPTFGARFRRALRPATRVRRTDSRSTPRPGVAERWQADVPHHKTSAGGWLMVVRSRYFEGEPCWAEAVAPDM